jgi:cytochrome c556
MLLRLLCRGTGALLLAGLVLASPLAGQAPTKQPRLEAVAETKLLMEGLAQANYRGLDRLLKQRPTDLETWTFARGQALLIAETANLLLLRPPKNPQGEKAWVQQSMDMRDQATNLARHLANRDYNRSASSLSALMTSCNRCHQTFRVPTRIGPEAEGREGGVRGE